MQSTGGDLWLISALVARSFGLIIALPLGEGLGAFSKVLLAAGVSLAVSQSLPTPNNPGVLELISEIMLGFMLAMPLRFVVDLSESFGELLDLGRGQMVTAVIDPLNGSLVSDLANLSRIAALALVFQLGAVDILLLLLKQSYAAVPIGSALDLRTLSAGLFSEGLSLIGVMLSAYSVWLGSFLLIESVGAFSARTARGLSWVQFSGALKMLVTLTLLVVLVSVAEAGGTGSILRRISIFLGLGLSRLIATSTAS